MKTLYWVARDPRTPWYARFFIAAIVAYAMSPVDLIPDAIPILGQADDLLAVSLGLWLASRFVPADALREYRDKAPSLDRKPWSSILVGALMVLLWLTVAILLAHWLIGKLGRPQADALLGY